MDRGRRQPSSIGRQASGPNQPPIASGRGGRKLLAVRGLAVPQRLIPR